MVVRFPIGEGGEWSCVSPSEKVATTAIKSPGTLADLASCTERVHPCSDSHAIHIVSNANRVVDLPGSSGQQSWRNAISELKRASIVMCTERYRGSSVSGGGQAPLRNLATGRCYRARLDQREVLLN